MKLKNLIEILSLDYYTNENGFIPNAFLSIFEKDGAPILENVFLDQTGIPDSKTEWWKAIKDRKVVSVHVGADRQDRAAVSVYLDQ